ncbi:unnamed protein product [Urochloa humidicola]
MNCRSSLWSEPGGALHGACGGAGIPASFPEMAPARQHQRPRGDRAKEKKERREKLFFYLLKVHRKLRVHHRKDSLMVGLHNGYGAAFIA